MREVDWGGRDRRLTEGVRILCGGEDGKYPAANSLLVQGRSEAIVIDPSVEVVARGGVPVPVDAVVNSHAHEDHVAGNGAFPGARVHVHEADLPGIRSLDGFMAVFGIEHVETRRRWRASVLDEFHFAPRPDARGFRDGDVFELGGLAVEAVHLPGHTRGHSGFRVDGGVFYLSDIDLTGFGPYYGDAWSDLDDFEASLRRVRDEEADWYVTSHHKGVVEGRKRFLELLDAFEAVIGRRHDAMLEFLGEPRSLDELVERRFVYRPHVDTLLVEHVERRTATLHLERMRARGEVDEVEPGRFARRGRRGRAGAIRAAGSLSALRGEPDVEG
ncbi:MAG TPA: MBL fold metallo-hydrolase [Myxococcota bacterium]|nr:MBL fold metallo-hydrolase [Myxococcota bacterium]